MRYTWKKLKQLTFSIKAEDCDFETQSSFQFRNDEKFPDYCKIKDPNLNQRKIIAPVTFRQHFFWHFC